MAQFSGWQSVVPNKEQEIYLELLKQKNPDAAVAQGAAAPLPAVPVAQQDQAELELDPIAFQAPTPRIDYGALAEDRKAAKQLEKTIEDYAAIPLQTDLTPLLSLTDAWSGSNFAKNYERPISKEEKTLQIAKLQDMLTERRNKTLSALMDGRGAATSGRLQEGMVTKINDGEQSIRLLDDLITEVDANKDVMGPVAGKMALSPWAFTKDIERAKMLDNRIMQVRQVIGKMMEGGVLRRADEKKYQQMIGDINQDPRVTLQNLNRIVEEARENIRGYVSGLGRGGWDVSGFADIGANRRDASRSPGRNPAGRRVDTGKSRDQIKTEIEALKKKLGVN